MSRTIHSDVPRPLVLAGLLGLAGLLAPAVTHAQTIDGGRALLNRVPYVFHVTEPVAIPTTNQIDPVLARAVDGERALLGRWALGNGEAPSQIGPASVPFPELCQLDGDRALLGRCKPVASHAGN